MATKEQFRKSIVASGIWSDAEFDAFYVALPIDAQVDDADALADALVAQAKLTRFQADRLLTGSGAPLVLGDYVLLDKIGAGGMGQVYKAQHRHMKRLVAIKLMLPDYVKDEQSVRRFRREVEASARLEHPNIVTAFDSRVERDIHYLVMQYVDGFDLHTIIRKRGQLPVEQAIDYTLQAARGLAYAHAQGVVHRDIKPSNLLVDKNGVVKVLDVGLARMDGSASSEGLTASSQIMGTVDFMSPEQASDAHDVDVRSDIYSLGCTLWYLLTARPMYESESMVGRIMKHREAAVPSLAKERDDVTWPLEQIHRKMVAKRADQRYASMAEVIAALEAQSGRSSSPSGSVPEDPHLREFFNTVRPGSTAAGAARAALGAAPQTLSPAEENSAQYKTVDVNDSHVSTDSLTTPLAATGSLPPAAEPQPPSEGVAGAAPQAVAPATLPRPPRRRKRPVALIAAGFLGAAAVAVAGVIITIKNDKGEVVGKMELPPGHTATISDPTKTQPTLLQPPPPAVAPFNAQQARAYQQAWADYLKTSIEVPNSLGMKMVLIPPSEFLMGTSDAEIEAAKQHAATLTSHDARYPYTQYYLEGPQHSVTLTRPYRVAEFETTVTQFAKFADATKYVTTAEADGKPNTGFIPEVGEKDGEYSWRNPGWKQSAHEPVVLVSADDAMAFCNWFSRSEGLPESYIKDDAGRWVLQVGVEGYRLPTEAEWENACRAGTTTPWWWGADEKAAGRNENLSRQMSDVGHKAPNPFGLFDMLGNAGEWCADFSSRYPDGRPAVDPVQTVRSNARMVRGGNNRSNAVTARSAKRGGADRVSNANGFRIVRTVLLPTASALPGASVAPASAAKTPVADAPGSPPPPANAPFDAAQAKRYQEAWAKHLGVPVERTNSVGAKMILLPPGEFTMGSSAEEAAAAKAALMTLNAGDGVFKQIASEERPHVVKKSSPTRMSATEVTVAQFRRFVEATKHVTEAERRNEAAKKPADRIPTWRDPGYPQIDDHPVTYVSWNDAVQFCRWLSGREQIVYRLPSGADWEYACRAGTTTQYCGGDDETSLGNYGWHNKNAGSINAVAKKAANPFGLYDMHGNVWELCANPADDTVPKEATGNVSRVVKGGNWHTHALQCRSASRAGVSQDAANDGVGFRLVAELEGPADQIAPSN